MDTKFSWGQSVQPSATSCMCHNAIFMEMSYWIDNVEEERKDSLENDKIKSKISTQTSNMDNKYLHRNIIPLTVLYFISNYARKVPHRSQF